MNKYIFVLALFLTFTACTKPNLGTLGEWNLIEYYGDPGDGSGTFQAVDSDKTLLFYDDGTFEVKNGSLCDLGAESGDMTGTYEEVTNIITVDCPGITNPFPYSFEINADNELLLYYPCIEPCVEKYEKQ